MFGLNRFHRQKWQNGDKFFMNLFTHDSLLSRFFYLVGDIITLHLLWILCSLPIFTIGASTTALYYSCMKRIRTKEGYPLKNFFASFKMNFKQSTLIWLCLLVIGFLFFADFRIAMALGNTLGHLMLIACSCFFIPYLLIRYRQNLRTRFTII